MQASAYENRRKIFVKSIACKKLQFKTFLTRTLVLVAFLLLKAASLALLPSMFGNLLVASTSTLCPSLTAGGAGGPL